MTKSDNFMYVLNVTQIQKTGSLDVDTTIRLHIPESTRMANDLRQPSAVFEARFSRCRNLLYFLACRVLGSSEQAHGVVEKCKVTASRNPPAFEYEGAFRSWLARVLIDEALAIVRQRKSGMANSGAATNWRNS